MTSVRGCPVGEGGNAVLGGGGEFMRSREHLLTAKTSGRSRATREGWPAGSVDGRYRRGATKDDKANGPERRIAQLGLVEARRAVVELESAATWEAALLEELRELSWEPTATLERTSALVGCGVVRVVAVVEALAKF